jgi:hypothetical protein
MHYLKNWINSWIIFSITARSLGRLLHSNITTTWKEPCVCGLFFSCPCTMDLKVLVRNDFKSIPLFSLTLKLLEQIPHCLFVQDFMSRLISFISTKSAMVLPWNEGFHFGWFLQNLPSAQQIPAGDIPDLSSPVSMVKPISSAASGNASTSLRYNSIHCLINNVSQCPRSGQTSNRQGCSAITGGWPFTWATLWTSKYRAK